MFSGVSPFALTFSMVAFDWSKSSTHSAWPLPQATSSGVRPSGSDRSTLAFAAINCCAHAISPPWHARIRKEASSEPSSERRLSIAVFRSMISSSERGRLYPCWLRKFAHHASQPGVGAAMRASAPQHKDRPARAARLPARAFGACRIEKRACGSAEGRERERRASRISCGMVLRRHDWR